jgi:hypothetical protein
MAIGKFYNRAGMSSSTTGTGTITLGSALAAGTAINSCGFQTFATAGVTNGDVVSYLILDSNGAWEYGTGTYTAAGTTLSRTLGQSSTGSLLSLTSSSQVFVTVRKEDLVPEYDEGSWTPVLGGATTAGTQTYSTQVGRYVRVGNSIHLWCRIVLTALDAAAAGAAQITGLPFAASTVTGLNFPGFVGPAALITHAAGYTQFVAQVSGSSSTISIQEIGDNITNASVAITNFHNTSTIQIAITYRTG